METTFVKTAEICVRINENDPFPYHITFVNTKKERCKPNIARITRKTIYFMKRTRTIFSIRHKLFGNVHLNIQEGTHTAPTACNALVLLVLFITKHIYFIVLLLLFFFFHQHHIAMKWMQLDVISFWLPVVALMLNDAEEETESKIQKKNHQNNEKDSEVVLGCVCYWCEFTWKFVVDFDSERIRGRKRSFQTMNITIISGFSQTSITQNPNNTYKYCYDSRFARKKWKLKTGFANMAYKHTQT